MAAPVKYVKKIKISSNIDPMDIESISWGGYTTNNIKTINGQSIFSTSTSPGDIIITYPTQDHGTNGGSSTNKCSISPNVFHVWGTVSQLYITLDNTNVNTNYANEYIFQFTCASGLTSLTLPSNIKWANGVKPSNLEVGTIYQISILNNCGTIVAFK